MNRFRQLYLLVLLAANFIVTNSVDIRPVPWLTEESIEFLERYLVQHPNANVLEFGSGASTVWLAKRTKNLYSIEHDKNWYNLIKNKLNNSPDCFSVYYFLLDRPYYTICASFEDNFFDLIIVDGRNRKGCIANSIRILKPAGILMLDNAERLFYHAIFSLMNNWEKKVTEQKKPDSCNFFYPGWQTVWWIKSKI